MCVGFSVHMQPRRGAKSSRRRCRRWLNDVVYRRSYKGLHVYLYIFPLVDGSRHGTFAVHRHRPRERPVKTKTGERTRNPKDAIAAIAPYRESRCEVCGHTIGAHFTSPDRCQVPHCSCTRYLPPSERKVD